MKILFICGTIEPGRDGVGDYTRRLACDLKRKGHEVQIIGYRDKFVSNSREDVQIADGTKIITYRIPAKFSVKNRLEEIKKLFQKFAPDWISLQYVPYAYHQQGLPLMLGKNLKTLYPSAKWHLMIHESYIEKVNSFKNKFVKPGQIISLQLIKKHLKPAVIHTSIPRYQKLLSDISIKSEILGLFGNIEIEPEVAKKVDPFLENKQFLTALFFGTAPEKEVYDVFAEKIRDFCHGSDRGLKLIFCGKSGIEGEIFANTIKEVCKKNIDLEFLGILEAKEVSQLFSSVDIGIARVPPNLLGKSGSAISMLEHGLPLWVPLAYQTNISDFFNYRSNLCFSNLDEIANLEGHKTQESRLPEITDKFLKALLKS